MGHYRIVDDRYSRGLGYEVQRRWLGLLWFQCWGTTFPYNSHRSMESAERFAYYHAKGHHLRWSPRFVLNQLGELLGLFVRRFWRPKTWYLSEITATDRYVWGRRSISSGHDMIVELSTDGAPDLSEVALIRAITRSWETGETVVWNEGDPLP
jgi:hypothetical protein